MKKIYLLSVVLLVGCVETDFEDPFEPSFMISTAIRDITFRVSGTYELQAVFTDEAGDTVDLPVTWQSSDPSVIEMNGNTAHCVGEGLVFLTASSGNFTDQTVVEVGASRASLLISEFVTAIQTEDQFTFKVNYLNFDGEMQEIQPTWSSSNDQIATIDQSGDFTAISEGMVTISASNGNLTDQVEVIVTGAPVMVDPEIRIINYTMFLEAGESFQFVGQYIGEDGLADESVTLDWSSSNPAIVSIDETGIALAQLEGAATISASFDDLSASVNVTVEGGEGNTARSSTLEGVRGYDIRGAVQLAMNGDGDVILNVENYVPDGPGPYFYLSSSPTSIGNAINLGEARASGSYEINVSSFDPEVSINTFDYVIVWCEPFGVRLGFGEFSN